MNRKYFIKFSIFDGVSNFKIKKSIIFIKYMIYCRLKLKEESKLKLAK